MQFVLASHNQNKLAEMTDILGALGIEILLLPKEAPEPEENGATFEENALIKARAAAALTGLPALADDSGLCVDALGGAPGIYSARYGSDPAFDGNIIAARTALLTPHATDRDRTLYLLHNLENVPDGARQAQFVCAVACVFPQGKELTVRGECEGEITRHLYGQGGFGYDPVFYIPQLAATFAQLPTSVKNQISHRAHALARLKEKLQLMI